ncbi:putative fungal-specific transcription factor [Plectosphaerella plurivora]|uniref:Fungal-specific transcription factor n=1 Tax=Plectosphaerella plurivora TaxID=936078 RepID=A0A9P8V4M6_9PEZI|nr:putative fungal-specific transcription factor [Plectosphaerella plurivora]
MPRPKLLPSQRQRAAEACNLCREAKRRCSGTTPCAHCVRRGTASSCTMTFRPRGSRSTGAGSDGGSTGTRRIDASRTDDPARAAARPPGPRRREDGNDATPEMFRPISPSESRPEQDTTPTDSQQTSSLPNQNLASMSPHPRMLLNRRGERVFVGGAASISFLHLIRGVVADQIGPSPFSHNDANGTMMEAESRQEPDMGSPLATGLPGLDPETRVRYARVFFAVTEGFLDVFNRAEVDLLLQPDDFPQNLSSQRQAGILLAIAIGAQCEAASSAEAVGQPFFRIAQARAFDEMLENPDLDMVRVFLLMAFYMLGACRRNAAFMYLGIATRAALALGLHCRESYDNLDDSESQLRIRVWMSVRILDKLTNSILGRPSATAGVHSELDDVLDELSAASSDRRTDCLIAAHNVVSIINDIITKLYDWKVFTVGAVEERLRDLETWKRQLPESLKAPPAGNGTEQQSRPMAPGVVGNLHVSCLYYFAVTLATRPILMSALATRPSQGDSRSNMAAACLDAAMYLVQICVEARDAGVLHGNMCILKALVFPAGLILGFEIFAGGPVDYGIETAFHDSKEILQYLAPLSPQAAHYVEILNSLSNAIRRHRARPGDGGRRQYVSKLFSFDSTRQQQEPPQQQQDERGDGESSSAWTEDATGFLDAAGGSDVWSMALRQLEPGDLVLDWESLNISQWDNFPFPVAGMPGPGPGPPPPLAK